MSGWRFARVIAAAWLCASLGEAIILSWLVGPSAWGGVGCAVALLAPFVLLGRVLAGLEVRSRGRRALTKAACLVTLLSWLATPPLVQLGWSAGVLAAGRGPAVNL